MTRTLDLARNFVHLGRSGAAELVELVPSFWRESTRADRYGWLVGVFEFASSQDLHSSTQELHPEGDELIFVVSGAIDVLVDDGSGEVRLSLDEGRAAIVPRGRWHRIEMRAPGKLLVVNRRTGMESRER